MDGKGHDGGGGGGGGGVTGATTLITTESVALVTPSVQSMVRVVGLPIVGYQEWSGLIGPSEPEVEGEPVTPEGEVSLQAVALVEVQE